MFAYKVASQGLGDLGYTMAAGQEANEYFRLCSRDKCRNEICAAL